MTTDIAAIVGVWIFAAMVATSKTTTGTFALLAFIAAISVTVWLR